VRDASRLSELGTSSLGVWRRRDALLVLTRDELDADIGEGTVHCPLPGVCMDGGTQPSDEQWLAIAVLASSDSLPAKLGENDDVSALVALGCGRTAARVLGVPLVDDDDPATGAHDEDHHDVAVFRHLRDMQSRPHEHRPTQTLHRYQLRLDRKDLLQHRCGIYLTSYVRTLYDLTSLISREALVCAIDWCLHHRKVTLEELEAFATAHKGWRSTPAFRRAVELADGRSESPHETLTRLLLKPMWPQLTPQVRLYDERGVVVARFDHADEDVRLAVESDGRAGHSGQAMKAKDDRRDRRTEGRFGYATERVTWFEVRRQQAATRARVLAVRDARRARLRDAA
jgi:hypothetical protein